MSLILVYGVGGWIERDIYLHASPEFASLSVLHFGRTIHKLTWHFYKPKHVYTWARKWTEPLEINSQQSSIGRT